MDSKSIGGDWKFPRNRLLLNIWRSRPFYVFLLELEEKEKCISFLCMSLCRSCPQIIFCRKRSPLCTFDRIFETVAAITFDYSLYEEKDTGLLTSISFCSDDFEPYTRLYYKCALHFRSAVAKGRFRLGIIKMLLREWFFSNATRASKLLLLLVLHCYVL